MREKPAIDEIRATALTRINRSERNFKLAFVAAMVIESIFVISFLLLADFSNRLHVLLLIATVSSYTIVALGLVALGAYINRSVLRLMKAIELLGEREELQ